MADLGFTFITANVSLAPIWRTKKTTEENPRTAYHSLLCSAGLQPGGPVTPGEKINRCPDGSSKNKSDDSGWWTYHETADAQTGEIIAFGSYGSWREGGGVNHWCSKKDAYLSEAEKADLISARIRDREERDRITAERHTAAAAEAERLWVSAAHTAPEHAYCQRKGIRPTVEQARVAADGTLLVPAYFDGVICTLQRITDSHKRFLPGGRAKGAFLTLEKVKDGPVYLAEGFATGMTVASATGSETWISFSAGNLSDVAATIRKLYPLRQIIVAGDNDHATTGNPGLTAAKSAAQLVGGTALCPPDGDGKTDWNDWGLEFTRKNLKMPVAVASAPAPDYNQTALAGMILDTLNWINSTAFYQQPEISLLNILSAVGAVTGRRYKLASLGTRTNIYTLGIAPTGMGKDNSRKCIKTLFQHSGLEDFLGADEVRSGPGLLDHVAQRPSMLYQIDEYGMFLKAMGNANTPGYAQTIPAIMTKLWSSSSSTYATGNLKSEEGPPISIFEPCLSLYGTTTLSNYAEAMKASSVASGELNRYIVCKSKVDFPEPNFDVTSSEPSQALIGYWSRFKPTGQKDPVIVSLGDMRGELKRIKLRERELMMSLEAENLGGIYARLTENTLKVAMLLAIARNPEKPTLEQDTLAFAEQLVGDSLGFMLEFGREQMFEDEHHRTCNRVIDFMKRNKNQAERRDVMRGLHLSKRQMDEVQDTLGTANGSGKLLFDATKKPVIYTLAR